MEKTTKFLMAESFLRTLSMVLAVASAIILKLDTETKKVMFRERMARVKMLPSLWAFGVVASVASAYEFLQLCRCFALGWLGKNPCKENKFFVGILFLFDQATTYAMFTTLLAGAQGSLVALTGVNNLQWEKLCDIYTKFCVQAAVGVVFGLLSTIVMIIISSLSAYSVFRLCPSASRSFTWVAR